MEVYKRFQDALTNSLVKSSIDYGRKVQIKQSSKKQNTEQRSQFNEHEEQMINKYMSYFRENGIDSPIPFLYQPTPTDERLVAEAIRRIKNSEKSL